MRRNVCAFVVFLAIGVGVVAGGCGSTKAVTKTVTVAGTTPSAQHETVLFGHIKSLTRKGSRFELRFDPAWLLTGVAAERAAVEDGVIKPGEAVPNDNYVVEEGHRLLTFVVLPTAHVTVLNKGLRPTAIPVSELVQIVKGKNPGHRSLFDPTNHSGFWIQVGDKYPNPAISLDQQYHP